MDRKRGTHSQCAKAKLTTSGIALRMFPQTNGHSEHTLFQRSWYSVLSTHSPVLTIQINVQEDRVQLNQGPFTAVHCEPLNIQRISLGVDIAN